MSAKKIGVIITPPGVFVKNHEKITVDFLAIHLGYDVTFLAPDRRKNAKTPDIEMNGLHWEIKSPTGNSSRTIENNLRAAVRQSSNIVLDLRRLDGRVPTQRWLNEAERQFALTKTMKRLIVITRQEKSILFG